MHHSGKILSVQEEPQLTHQSKVLKGTPGHCCQLFIQQEVWVQEHPQDINQPLYGEPNPIKKTG